MTEKPKEMNTERESFNSDARLMKRLFLGVAIANAFLGVLPYLPVHEEIVQAGRPWSGFLLLASVLFFGAWAALRSMAAGGLPDETGTE